MYKLCSNKFFLIQINLSQLLKPKLIRLSFLDYFSVTHFSLFNENV